MNTTSTSLRRRLKGVKVRNPKSRNYETQIRTSLGRDSHEKTIPIIAMSVSNQLGQSLSMEMWIRPRNLKRSLEMRFSKYKRRGKRKMVYLIKSNQNLTLNSEKKTNPKHSFKEIQNW